MNTTGKVVISMASAKGKKAKGKDAKSERKTMTLHKETYERLANWKGGERRGISFSEAIDRLLEHAQNSGYKSALFDPKGR